MATPKIHVIGNADELQAQVVDLILSIASKAIQDHGFFSIGVSGGSVAKIVSQGLQARKGTDWKQWRFFFCDERHVQFDNADSTYALYKKEFFDPAKVPAENIFSINPDVSVQDAAKDYTEKIRSVYPGSDMPSFDLLLLGMGPDGHTCSLFPNHPGLNEKSQIVIPITDSPKPPPSRITLTVPVLNSAKNVFVIATGGSKVDAVKGCLEPEAGKDPLPAGLARPPQGELHWFLDPPAAAKIEPANK